MKKRTKTTTGKAKKTSAAGTCELLMCEDPVTGRVIVKSGGNCPPGYIEKVMKKAQQHGVTFELGGPAEKQ